MRTHESRRERMRVSGQTSKSWYEPAAVSGLTGFLSVLHVLGFLSPPNFITTNNILAIRFLMRSWLISILRVDCVDPI